MSKNDNSFVFNIFLNVFLRNYKCFRAPNPNFIQGNVLFYCLSL